MFRPHRARLVTAAGVGAAIVLAGAFAVTDSRTASAHTATAPSSSSTAPASITGTPASSTTAPPVAVAIGDSIMDGHNVQPQQAWPVLVAQADDWQLTNLSTDGTGFVQLGNDDNTFQAQVDEAAALSPSIVIISASSNDLGQDDDTVAAATLATMTSLRSELPDAQIIALSAFWGDTTPPAQLDDFDADLQTAAAATGATYINIGQPLTGHPELMQSDDVHPTALGLADLAAAIETDISAAGY